MVYCSIKMLKNKVFYAKKWLPHKKEAVSVSLVTIFRFYPSKPKDFALSIMAIRAMGPAL